MNNSPAQSDDGSSACELGSCNIRQLLHEQMELINRAREFNQLILQRLDEEGDQHGLHQQGSAGHDQVAVVSPLTGVSNETRFETQSEGADVIRERGPLNLVKSAWKWLKGKDDGDVTAPLLGGFQDLSSSKRGSPEVRNMFDEKSIKKIVERMLERDGYDVENFYYKTGICQAVARNAIFKNATLFVIILNTAWIAIDTDCNTAESLTDADPIFQIAAHLFCSLFTFELFVRFMSFERKCNALRDGWFLFDGFLVVTMVWETWVVPLVTIMLGSNDQHGLSKSSMLRSLRLLRIARSGRVVRVLRAFPEMMILVSAMLAAMRSVCTTLFLLILIMYVFAIIMTQMLKGTGVSGGGFETVLTSMNTLMASGIFPDQANSLTELLEHGFMVWLCFLAFLVLGVLTIMNLLIGIMCEVVGEVADAEKDTLTEMKIKQSLDMIIDFTDVDGDLYVTAQEFANLFRNEEAVRALHSLGIDVQALVDCGNLLFKRQGRITIDAFHNMLFGLRGSDSPSKKDIVVLRNEFCNEMQQLEGRLSRRRLF
eukprot:TRINITY_DN7241_c0_g1_i5.p1 TRINITY_DN7241_c0_g1~~TRINITY_DN7241_c0_g1_i5.p1  ORF type:complete len:541 (+),score=69.31 TRINITY_DN7241_c0_g1_i5:86-1708(+)